MFNPNNALKVAQKALAPSLDIQLQSGAVLGLSHLDLFVPNYKSLDLIRNAKEPFSLWPVGDLPLLFHWMDYAVDNKCECVRVFVVGDVESVRKQIEARLLWPLRIEVHALREYGQKPEAAITVDHLPGLEEFAPVYPKYESSDPWCLMSAWLQMNQLWLESRNVDPALRPWMIGRAVSLEKGAQIVSPVWIEDGVTIGRGAVIGPYAWIGKDSWIESGCTVSNAIVCSKTYLGPCSQLEYSVLEGGRLFNLKLRAMLENMDPLLAGAI